MNNKTLYDLNFPEKINQVKIKVNCGTVTIFKNQRDFDNVVEDLEFGGRDQYGGLCVYDHEKMSSEIYLFNSKFVLNILGHELGHAYFHSCGLSHITRNMGTQNIDELFALGCENLPQMAADYGTVLMKLEEVNAKYAAEQEKKESKKNVKTKKPTKKSKKVSK